MTHAPQPAPEAPPPRVVGGRFRLVRELGAGGMGTVHEAEDLQTGAAVALKLMRPELSRDERAVERFRREGAALASIRSPAVVEIREVGELEDGSLYIAMELLHGETLGAKMEREGTLQPGQLLPIVRGVCAGLTAAHAGGIVHRDVKPSNIHLTDARALLEAERTGAPAPVKLVDFGVARVSGFSRMTSTGLAIGTVRYMAPEQLSGATVDGRSDLYSLGVVLYEALAGESPFARHAHDDPVGAILVGRATPLDSLRADLGPAVVAVVHRAMARVAGDRFASAEELAEAFEAAVRDPHAAIAAPPSAAAAPLGFAETVPALPRRVEAPLESEVRERAPRRRRFPWLVLLPLLVGGCLVPTFGIAGFVGCGGYMTDVQMRSALRDVRGELIRYPEETERAQAIENLASLHAADRVNVVAAAAFGGTVQRALNGDNRIDPDELEDISRIAADIVAQGGAYDLDRYNEMVHPEDSL